MKPLVEDQVYDIRAARRCTDAHDEPDGDAEQTARKERGKQGVVGKVLNARNALHQCEERGIKYRADNGCQKELFAEDQKTEKEQNEVQPQNEQRRLDGQDL